MEGALLTGDKTGGKISHFGGLIKRTTVTVLRGELLVKIPGNAIVIRNDGQKPNNYQVKGDATISLLCDAQDVVPLGNYEFLLLESVKTPGARFSLFHAGTILDWGQNLKSGDDVYVAVPGLTASNVAVHTPRAAAKVRFVGGLGAEGEEPGIFFGVEIIDKKFRGRGSTDGTYRGHRYFMCADDCGLFVSLDRLSPDCEGSTLYPPPGGQPYTHGTDQVVYDQPRPSGRADHGRPPASEPGESPAHPPQFTKGDRVVVHNKSGVAVHGVVRWAGNRTATRQFDVYILGIEMDVPVRFHEFEYALTGMTHLFAAKDKRCQLFMPEGLVLSEDDYINKRAKQPSPAPMEVPTVKIEFGGLELSEEEVAEIREAEKQFEEQKQREDQPGFYPRHQGPSPWAYSQAPQPRQDTQPGNHIQLSIGSAVQLGDPPTYGVIRWIGDLPGVQGQIAGIELEKPVQGGCDGTWRQTGVRYFECEDPRWMYAPLQNLRPDERFIQPGSIPGTAVKPDHELERLQKEITQLRRENEELQEKVSQHQQRLKETLVQKDLETHRLEESLHQKDLETHRLEENLHQKDLETLRLKENLHQKDLETRRLEENLHQKDLETRRLEENIQHQQQQFVQTERTLRAQVQQLQGQAAQADRYRDQVGELQARVERMRLSPGRQLSSQEIEFWKISRQEVQIFGEIGSGAWGYVAKGIFRGREVAVKWPHRAILDAYIVDRLRREVRIMAQVRHPNLLLFIAAVFDDQADRLQEPPLIVTELLDMNLRSAYKEGRLEYSSKLPIFRDVACALHYLHQHHEPIIHRDVSAPNVLLEALPRNQWKAKLSDFGSANLAKLARTAGEGAIIYSAPETFPLDIHDPNTVIPPQTTKIDVYSYGVLLCEVITNQMPASEKYRSMLQQVQRQWPFMYDLIISCTKRKPEDRPTMAAVLSELNKITPR